MSSAPKGIEMTLFAIAELMRGRRLTVADAAILMDCDDETSRRRLASIASAVPGVSVT